MRDTILQNRMQKQFLWAVVIVLVLGAGYWLWQSNAVATPSADTGTQPTGTGSTDSPQAGVDVNVGASVSTTPSSAAITYNGSSFSPSQVTIKKGGTVTFTSTVPTMWVASGPHPAHTGYDSTSRSEHCAAGYAGAAPFDQCRAGTSYTYTFTKVGTWPFHDHITEGVFGKVTVVE